VSESYGPIKLAQEQWNQVGRPDPAAAPRLERTDDDLIDVLMGTCLLMLAAQSNGDTDGYTKHEQRMSELRSELLNRLRAAPAAEPQGWDAIEQGSVERAEYESINRDAPAAEVGKAVIPIDRWNVIWDAAEDAWIDACDEITKYPTHGDPELASWAERLRQALYQDPQLIAVASSEREQGDAT
jgi:hypothetical protein